MNNKTFTLAVACTALAVTLTALVIVDLRVASLARSVERLALRIEQIDRQLSIEQMSTTYLALHDGVVAPHTVTTTQRPNESDADFRARHFAAVTADQEGDWPIAH